MAFHRSRRYSITQLVLFQMLGISLFSVLIPAYFWISSELNQFRRDAREMRTAYVDSQKELIRHEVNRTIDYINYKKALTKDRLKTDLKNRVDEACALALNLLDQNREKGVNRLQELVREALRPIRFNDGRGYYFAVDMAGTAQLFPVSPEMEGTDMTGLTGANGEPVVQDMVAIVQGQAKGFYSYTWTKPGATGYFPKMAYVRKVGGLNWIIGTGEYLDDVTADIKREVLDRMTRIRFENSGYVFAGTWDGLSLSGPARGRNMLDVQDKNGRYIVRELIAAARAGGGFVEYVIPRFEGMKSALKLSYAAPVPEWKWYVGAGVYADEIETVIAGNEKQRKKQIYTHIRTIAVILGVIWLLALVVVRFLTGRTRKSFAVFTDFFSRASSNLLPIKADDIVLDEFAGLAEAANDMVFRRKEMEQALQQSEAKYRTLFEKSKDAILFLENGTFVDCNQATVEMLGYENKIRVLNTHPADLSPEYQPDGKPSFIKAQEMMDLALTNGSHRFEWDHVRSNGEVFPVEVLLTAISAESGQKMIHTTWRDVTARKQAEAEKIRAERHAAGQSKHALVGRIAGKMAHDFNNILGVIMGNAELCLMDCRDDAITKRLELIFGQTVRGRNLTRNLIAFAKDQEPKQEFFILSEKMDLVINLMKKDLADIRVVKAYGQDLPEVLADPGMIEHALMNLIQNAVHALSRTTDPVLTVRTRTVREGVCFDIEDNGCGIPEQHLEEIFEPSFTLKGSRDLSGAYHKEIKGTGYGMANVKRYVEQHMGTIEVDSIQEKGTCVTVCLPVIRRRLTAEEKQQVAHVPWVTGKRILLVEDEPAISEVQSEILRQDPCRHTVDVAADGKQAMAMFDQTAYDVISLDYLLPGELNGMDVYSHIRRIGSDVPILFVSGNIEFLESVNTLLEQDSCIDHLSKPCFNTDYIRAINKLLAKNNATKP